MNIRNVVMSLVLALGAAVSAFAGDYTRLEYIKSTGAQYFDTGVAGRSDLAVKMRISGFSSSPYSYTLAACKPGQWGSEYIAPFAKMEQGVTGIYKGSYDLRLDWGSAPTELCDIDAVLAKGHQALTVTNVAEGVVWKEASASVAGSFDTGHTLYAFALNKDGTVANFAKMQCYSMDIWQDDVLVRSYRPAKRNSDGAIGMIDIANNNAFYPSATDTAFEAGPEVVNNTITVAGFPDAYGTPDPGYGELACTPGETYTFSVDQMWTNDAKNVRATCTGWKYTLDDGTETEGLGEVSKTVVYGAADAGAVLTWQFDAEYLLSFSTSFDKKSVETWKSYGEIVSLDVPEPPSSDYVFDHWEGTGVTEENAKDNPFVFAMTGPTTLRAVFKGSGVWTYADGQVSDENGNVFTVAETDAGLQLKTVVSIGTSDLDLTGKVFSTDGFEEYVFVGTTAYQEFNLSGVTSLKLPTNDFAIANSSFANLTAITNIVPFYPDTWSTIPSFYNKKIPVTNDLVLASPTMTTVPSSAFMWAFNGLMSVDMTGSSISTFGGSAFNTCNKLTNVTFAAVRQDFDAGSVFSGCTAVQAVRFRGDPPTFNLNDAMPDSTRYFYYLPKWNRKWEAFLQDATRTTVAEMDGTTWNVAVPYHAGEAMPVQTLRMHSTTTGAVLTPKRGIVWWYPDCPPAYTELSWFDVLGYDGSKFALAEETDRALVDGTTYTPVTPSAYAWLAAAGHEVVLEVPSAAATTRGLKLTGYRLHQLAKGDWPNGRAPTAWQLFGKTLDSDDWTLIDEVSMTAASENAWAYLKDSTYTVGASKSQTCPPRADCSLTFTVPVSAQLGYKAFKFVPSASYNSENGIEDETPIGLMELEFLGEVTTPDPKIASFAVTQERWSEVAFAATISGFGENAATGVRAHSAVGWVEVYADAEKTELVAATEKTDLTVGAATPFVVSGLVGNTSYCAVYCVSNDLAAVATEEVPCATLAEPWTGAKVTCAAKDGEADRFTVSFTLDALYADAATLTLELADTPSGPYTAVSQPIDASTAGTFVFAGDFARSGALQTARVTVTGGGVARSYTGSAGSYWMVDDVANPTRLVDSLGNASFTVAKHGWLANKIKITSVQSLPADGVVDFSSGVYSPDGGTQLSVYSMSTAFKGNRDLKKIIFPDTVTDWESYAFQNCTSLEEIVIPAGLTSIGASYVFDGCTALKKVVWHDGITSLGNYTFQNCLSLVELSHNLPNSLTSIGYGAFYGCSKLPNFILPPGTTSIPGVAFSGCKALTEVTIPDTVTSIGGSAFSGCSSLSNFYPRFLPPQLTSAGTWGNIGVVGDLVIGNPAITEIAGTAFQGLTNITNIDMTGSSIVSNIGYWAFQGCSKLQKVTFPQTFNRFKDVNQIFQTCNKLNEVVFLGAPPEVETNPFPVTGLIVKIPRSSAEWQQYIADHSTGDAPWVTPMTAQEKKAFKAKYPGRTCAGLWINLGGKTGKNYLCYDPEHEGFMILVK